jgi:hypothetical protein
MPLSRTVAGATGVALLAALPLLAAPGSASADPKTQAGYAVKAQPYRNNPDQTDWLGSYQVAGKQVWCVQFAFKAPDSADQYQPGEELRTKWGDPLAPDVAADISYLLLRYADTTSPDEAAALAHLLHSWTAGSTDRARLDPGNDFRTIGYDVDLHLGELPQGARDAVTRLRRDAETNHGPWTASVTAPNGTQTIGQAAPWRIEVRGASGKAQAKVPVSVTLTDARLADGATSGTLRTPDDGGPLVVQATPTGPKPTLVAALDAPAQRPKVEQVLDAPDKQRIVSTGGQATLTGQAAGSAAPAPTTPSPTTAPPVPVTIPAGDAPRPAVADAAVVRQARVDAVLGLGGLAVLAAVATVGLLWRRRATTSRR